MNSPAYLHRSRLALTSCEASGTPLYSMGCCKPMTQKKDEIDSEMAIHIHLGPDFEAPRESHTSTDCTPSNVAMANVMQLKTPKNWPDEGTRKRAVVFI